MLTITDIQQQFSIIHAELDRLNLDVQGVELELADYGQACLIGYGIYNPYLLGKKLQSLSKVNSNKLESLLKDCEF